MRAGAVGAGAKYVKLKGSRGVVGAGAGGVGPGAV